MTAGGIGLLHGIGAETPTQILLFLTAAGAPGRALGAMLVLLFVIGLLIANTVLATVTRLGLLGGQRWPRLYRALAVVTAAFNLVVGFSLLTSS